MKKLFESKKKRLLQLERPTEQLHLPKHPMSSMSIFYSIKILGNLFYIWACKKHCYKKHEMSVGSDSINITFFGSNREFDWLEISLVYD